MTRIPQKTPQVFRQQFTFATTTPDGTPFAGTPVQVVANDLADSHARPLFAPPPPQADGTLEQRWLTGVTSGDRWSVMDGTASIVPFLMTLTPGMAIVMQYDCQPSAYAVFQGFEGNYVLVSNYLGVPGLLRVSAGSINAVSVF